MNNSFIGYAEPYKIISFFFCFLKRNFKISKKVC